MCRRVHLLLVLLGKIPRSGVVASYGRCIFRF